MARRHGEFSSVREAILSTAASLFIRKGVSATSLGDIASEAKLSKGTLYYYYPVKDELILTIAEECLSRITDQLLSWVDGLSREEELRGAIVKLLRLITNDARSAGLYAALCADCMAEDSLIRDTMLQYRQKWKLLLELGALRIESSDSRLLGERAELFFTLLSGFMLQRFGGMPEVSLEAIADAIARE